MNKALENKFIGLLEEHQNIAHKICKMYTYDADAHKDLFQEITIQLWKAYPKFREESKFSTWMYRVALNTAITLYRKKKERCPDPAWENFDFKISAEGYDSTLDDNLKLMYSAIKELNDIDKALVLLYLEDKPYTEISETLGISEVNARVKMNRVKTKLKTILNPLIMDELDLIKKDWQSRTKDLPKYTKDELMPMLHKKSSSNVKWIFIISILEFVFWIAIDVLVSSEEYLESIKSESFLLFLKGTTIINYIVLFGFIYLFCKNYLRIKVSDSAKNLMQRIIKTRLAVKYYVRYNIGLFILIFIISGARAILMQTIFNTLEFWIITGIMLFILLIIIGFLILFYKVLYGILTKRLLKNYKLLNQMEL